MRRLPLVPLLPSALIVAILLTATPVAADGATRYAPPVPGAVLQAFSAPEHAYAPGHRGVDLAVRAGEPVRAAAGGEVVFAGRVARSTWVTVRHGDGIRTSYGALAELRVAAGDAVTRGQVLATATGSHGTEVLRPEPGLHWSARRGETYLDPLTLLDGPPPRPTLVGEGGWSGTHPVVEPYAPYPGGSRFGFLATPSPPADRQGFPIPPNHHHLLQLPGYGTSGPHPIIDADKLGYGPEDRSVFSYAGCDPTPEGCDPRPYGGQDTDLSIDDAAALLDAHLRARQRAQPHRPVDLLGHSMGGDVATHYLTYVYDPRDPELPPVRNLGTIATPHGGSGTATIARAGGDDALLGTGGELLRMLADGLGFDPAGRVSLASEPVSRYGAPVWADRPERDPDRLAEHDIDVLEIAGSRDLVVGRTDAASSGDVLVLPGGHTSVLESEAAYEALYRFLGDRDVAEVDSRVGWGSNVVSDAGRTIGTLIDVAPVMTVTRLLAAGDVPGVLWEVGKSIVGGPGRRSDDAPDPAETPMAPDVPLAPPDALS